MVKDDVIQAQGEYKLIASNLSLNLIRTDSRIKSFLVKNSFIYQFFGKIIGLKKESIMPTNMSHSTKKCLSLVHATLYLTLSSNSEMAPINRSFLRLVGLSVLLMRMEELNRKQ